MKKHTHLIQRLEFPATSPDSPFKKLAAAFSFGGGLVNGGLTENAMKLLRPIFGFDYMGSAEFEFGAVQQSIAVIAKSSENYISGSIEINPKKVPIYYICQGADKEDVQELICQLAEDKYRNLKEASLMKQVLEGDSYAAKRIGGWLEIDNHFFFFTDKTMFEKVAELFQIKNEKVAELFQTKEGDKNV